MQEQESKEKTFTQPANHRAVRPSVVSGGFKNVPPHIERMLVFVFVLRWELIYSMREYASIAVLGLLGVDAAARSWLCF